ncbi:MAG: flagellar basal body-associated FliL family protein [Aquabacterium sp.]|uniref:flagellar basal body-associated FliL family protein n=1 Tax=Aquabacterium sp. TaxID=1872578 RepID=UPI003BDBBE10
MSAPAAAPAEGEAPKKGPKKLVIIGAVVALLLVLGGGGAFYMMKKKAADAAAAEGGDAEGGDAHHEAPAKSAKKPSGDKHAGPPTFVPLDPFIVNLTDRDSERYAQVGITLQVDDPHMGDEMKAYMPAIRNAVLLVLSHKSSADLLSAEGKEKLAHEIRRDAARAMGYEIYDPDEEAEDPEAETSSKKKKKKRPAESYNPIVQVHYSNFIIQ